jgi:PPK2 family polyphosphate:nucleotide phosphotransferase
MTTKNTKKSPWDRYLVPPGTRVRLGDYSATDVHGLTRERVEAARPALAEELADLQELLYAAGDHAFLIVLQGMDTSGKDGAIKNVMEPVNPQGVQVASFKSPSHRELSHDYLWRVHAAVPPLGMIGIFNRSHYEDVLIVRVHSLVPPAVWRKRYRHINEFERMLTDSRITVLKFFLHISKEEQKQRLLDREEEPEKAWKLAVGDWREREHWDEYVKAYEDALGKTSTDYAPWHVIPADKKWARNHILMSMIVEAMRPLAPAWHARLDEIGRKAKAELEAYRSRP